MSLSDFPRDVTLVVVSKKWSIEKIQQFYDQGVRDFGENRVQELLEKRENLPKDIRWHFIGPLQKNKIAKLIGKVALIHSVDSPELAALISEKSIEKGYVTPILLQIRPDRVFNNVPNLPGIEVRGLMTMASMTDDFAIVRACFVSLRQMAKGWGLSELSMGMSRDYKIALEEGATILRIGRYFS